MMKIHYVAASVAILMFLPRASAAGKATPRVDMTSFDFQTLPPQQQDEFLNNFTEVLNEAEASSKQNFTIKRDAGRRDVPICVHAGWIFNPTADQHCQFEEFNKGCGDSKLRCAPWTGSQECAPLSGNATLLSCFKPKSVNGRVAVLANQGDATTFSLLWNLVAEICQSSTTKKRTSCQNLMAIANQSHSGFRIDQLDDSFKRFSNFDHFSSRLIQLAEAAQNSLSNRAYAETGCGYDEKTQVFTKKTGEKLRFLFGAHADPRTLNSFLTQAFSSQITAEKRAALIGSYLSLAVTQSSLHDLHIQAQQLKQMNNLDWAGTEHTPTELSATNIKAHREERKILVQIMRNSGVPETQISDVLLLNYGPVLDRELAKSEAERAQDIIGAEDIELRSRFHELEKSVMSEDLNQLANEKRFTPTSAAAFTKVYVDSLIRNHLPDATDRETVLSTISDTDTKAAMNSSFKALYDLIATKIARDKLAASRFLNHSGNAVIIYGSDHKEGLIGLLNDSCKTPSGPTEAPPANQNSKTTDARISQ